MHAMLWHYAGHICTHVGQATSPVKMISWPKQDITFETSKKKKRWRGERGVLSSTHAKYKSKIGKSLVHKRKIES